MYLNHTLAVTCLAGRASGFVWDSANVAIAMGYLTLIVAVFAGFQLLTGDVAVLLGLVSTVLAGCLSVAALTRLVPPEAMPSLLRPLAAWLARAAR